MPLFFRGLATGAPSASLQVGPEMLGHKLSPGAARTLATHSPEAERLTGAPSRVKPQLSAAAAFVTTHPLPESFLSPCPSHSPARDHLPYQLLVLKSWSQLLLPKEPE